MRKPIKTTASGAFFSPVFDNIKLAKLSVAFDFSSKIPTVVPKIINKPIFSSVEPKPVLSIVMTFSPSKPAANPTVAATINKTKKVFNLNRALKMMMAAMLNTKSEAT